MENLYQRYKKMSVLQSIGWIKDCRLLKKNYSIDNLSVFINAQIFLVKEMRLHN